MIESGHRPRTGWTRTLTAILAIGVVAAALRFAFPLADPPWRTTVGVVWHDEGAWVHNARNRVLFGEWRLDAWNPMYLAPVFNALEYASFASFGVGTWQARLVSQVAGLMAVVAIGLGVTAISTRRAGYMAALLLATNYVYVMYDRAALMESTMTALMVMSWAAYARSAKRPARGLFAGPFAMLSLFAKGSAASFVAALGADSLLTLLSPRTGTRDRRLGAIVLCGLIVAGIVALAVFVVPYWTEVRFYNWQMSVTRKPSYTIRAFVDRASWVPILHDVSTRMWFETLLAFGAAFGIIATFRQAAPAERLLVWWVSLGILELVLHDTGNERRFVQLIPPVIALAATVLGRDRLWADDAVPRLGRRTLLLASPIVLYALYLVSGGLLRLISLYETRPSVWVAAAGAIAVWLWTLVTWPKVPQWLARERWRPALSIVLLLLITMGDIAEYVQWAVGRSYKNYAASVAIGRWVPAGTLVHGKLANGLSLENGIRPVFVGTHFGNYDDRLRRDDVQYLLTYVEPRIGFEGPVILDVLAAYPNWRILRTVEVAETPGAHDRAALIVKGSRSSLAALDLRSGLPPQPHRAHD
jgi:4-amino-4-deoxy-L-arabinose transferase-like glycosyltransferase